MDYEAMTIEQLETENSRLAEARNAAKRAGDREAVHRIRAEQAALWNVLNLKLAARHIDVRARSDETLAQIVGVTGIDSQERF